MSRSEILPSDGGLPCFMNRKKDMELCAACIIGIKVGSKSIPPSQLSHFMKIDSAHNSKENAKKRENTPIIMNLSQMADPGPKCGYFGILS